VPKRTEQLHEYKVVFLVGETGISQKAFDLAIDTARAFSAKLVLTYLIEHEEVPEGYVEFANVEGVRDYESEYFNMLASNKLAGLGEKAQAAGIDWATQLYFGNVKKATKYYVDDKRAIVIVNHATGRSIFGRLGRLWSRKAPNMNAPVIYN
jgi:hypothetical protein